MIERRYINSDFEIRAKDDGKKMLRGYALKFGVPYDMGWFIEEIADGALNEADMSDVRILFNHDPNLILGRTTAGTARIAVDKVGLYYEADLPDSPNGENVRVALERGDITQSSWGFELEYDYDNPPAEWTKQGERDYRTIRKVKRVFDASPVTFPANPDTTAAKRSLEDYQKQQTNTKAKIAEIDCILASTQQ
jgi:HK97 family phage prohead protease